MPGAPAVSLLVHVEHLNLHWSSDISQHMARGWGKGPAGGVAKWVWEGCSLSWRIPRSWGQPALTVAMGLYGADLPAETCCLWFSSVQLLSCIRLCDPMDCSTPGFPVHYQLPELTQAHILESVMPSNYLILCCPLLLWPSIFPSIRVFPNESVLHIRWPKYWSFSLSISPSNEYSRLIFFRMNWLDLPAVQGTLKSVVFSNTTVQKHQFFSTQLSL